MEKKKTTKRKLFVLTPDKNLWDYFYELLDKKLVVNSNVECPLPGKCKNDHRYAREILKKPAFKNVDIEKTIEFFCDNGGYCDCEVLLNVEADYKWEKRSKK